MLEWFSSIGFLNAAAFSLLAIGPILVFAYLKKAPRQKRIVSSLLILKTLPKRRAFRRRVKPPLRFYLELLALLLMGLAAAWPIVHERGERIAIVLDSSLSMLAKSGGFDGTDRFHEAVTGVDRFLSDQSNANTYTLFTTAPKFQRKGTEFVSAGTIRSALSAEKAVVSSDTLAVSVSELAESGVYGRVVVFSDREADFIEKKGGTGEKSSTVIESITVGKPVANYYLSSLRIDRAGLEGQKSLNVGAGLSAAQATDLELKIFGAAGKSTSPDFKQLATQIIRAEPDKVMQAVIDLPAQSNTDFFRVELSAAGNSSQLTDAIIEDNAATVSEDGSGENSLLLVTPSTSEDALGLKRIATLNVTQLSPAEFLKLSPDELGRFSVLIFHNSAPNFPPKVPTLLVLPPDQNPIFPIISEVANPRITSWAEDHPLTSYLHVPLLTADAAAIFRVPLWAQGIINAEPGAILVAGESRGIRFAGLGIEIFPFEGGKTPAFSVLTLNILNWLSSSSAAGSENLSKTPATSSGTLPVNPFFPGESQTFSKSVYQTPRVVYHTELIDQPGNPAWPRLLEFAAVILLFELILRTFRVTQEA